MQKTRSDAGLFQCYAKRIAVMFVCGDEFSRRCGLLLFGGCGEGGVFVVAVANHDGA